MKKILALLLVLISSSVFADDRPNILWLTCEDNNINWVGCYGNPFAETPNIDKLAEQGVQYMHCYSNAPVCAPMRSTWITGVHSMSMGTYPMRSRYPIPHETIKYYPDLLKKAGYYVGNAKKTDYNIGGRDDKDAWDTDQVNWTTLKKNQPFFMVINSTKSHESKAFGDVNNTTHSPADVRLAKYHPDLPDIRKNYAHYHDQMLKMDADIGKALADLEKSGMAENTIVIHNSDHGGVLARSKRFLFNSGTHCPLIIRIPDKYKHLRPAEAGSKVDQLVSFVDMTKTWLNICGAETPGYLSGKVFLGPDTELRDYHVSYRGRMDERCDNVRAIRDTKLLYIRNYMPYAPWGQKLEYLWRMKATQAWDQHHREGKTNTVTGRFFGTKPMEELYYTAADPDNVVNLIDDPKYAADIARLSKALDQWQVDHFDSGLLPETEVAKRSEECGKTIYEMVRDPALYDLKAYQTAAAKALEQDVANLPGLYSALNAPDSGIRYWAVVGCFNLQGKTTLDMARFKKCLNDECHHVRAMAAWILYRAGDTTVAQDCWNELLSNSSYASLLVFNIVDWIGDGIEPYAEAMKACEFEHQGYIQRTKESLGLDEAKPKQNSKNKNGFDSLFDGKSLDGWASDNLGFWRVEDGAIVGGDLVNKVKQNEFLRSTKEYDDFELRLQFKLVGEKTNAGVQFRTADIPNDNEVMGYQADLGDDWWGCLYDESRRRKILAGPPADERAKPVRIGQWNDYRIRCKGKRIQLWINGIQTVDYTEPDPEIPQTGIIALQVHGNLINEAHYRNIRIKTIQK